MEERRVAEFFDGWRPLARVRSKSGLGANEFRSILASLVAHGSLRVVGLIVEPSIEVDIDIDAGDDGPDVTEGEQTMSRVEGGGIPPHVMAEIEAMIEEEVRRAQVEETFDDMTDVVRQPTGSATPGKGGASR